MPTGRKGSHSRGRRAESGFTLAAMIVIMAVMAILLTVAVQTATFQRQREKEEELIFRGQQAVEAIRLFRARNGRFPLTLDELVKSDPRVLRKPWADPITGKPDWVPVFLGQAGDTIAGGGAPTEPPEKHKEPGSDTDARGPIIGVRSRSCQDSIKVYEGHSRYCEWKFVFDPQKAGGGGGGGVQPVPPTVVPTRP